MNVLIVDDDRFVVSALEKKIEWESLGITEVFIAYSLKQAQDIFAAHTINLLISDIEMPKGSGLYLLSWLRCEGNRVQVIFLTNHADFHYAQKAIALQSFEYCLKPIEFDKLSLIIRKAVEKIEKEILQTERAKQTEFLEVHQTRLLENYWQGLLHGTVSAPVPSIAERFYLVFISCFPYYLEGNEIRTHFDRKTPVNQRLCDLFSNAVCTNQVNLVTFFEYHAEKQQYAEVLRQNGAKGPLFTTLQSGCVIFLQELKISFQCEASCCISSVFTYTNVQETFQNLMDYHRDLKDCSGRVYVFEDSPAAAAPAPEFPIYDMEHCLETGDEEGCCTLFREYLSEAAKSGNLNHKLLSGLLMDATQLVFTYLKSKEVLAHKLFQNPVYEFLLRQYTDSLENAELYLHYLLKNAFDYLSFTASQASVAETIKNYIDSNYHRDLSRSDLANIVYLHPDYAARVFKNEMHISLNNYIIRKRITAAKKLLTETQLPVNTVADKVGYGNYSYFSKLFRRETGLTPQEWRRENPL